MYCFIRTTSFQRVVNRPLLSLYLLAVIIQKTARLVNSFLYLKRLLARSSARSSRFFS